MFMFLICSENLTHSLYDHSEFYPFMLVAAKPPYHFADISLTKGIFITYLKEG